MWKIEWPMFTGGRITNWTVKTRVPTDEMIRWVDWFRANDYKGWTVKRTSDVYRVPE